MVVGGSVAAVTAAETLRLHGFSGEVTIVSAESHPPYSRVPLTKGVLAGRQRLESVRLPAVSTGITLRLGTAAVGLDPAGRTVRLADGTSIGYDGLVIASGGRARRLTADPGELCLRTIDDYATVDSRIRDAGTATVIGGGFLGMEAASTLVERGLAVTVVDRDPPLERLVGAWLARRLVTAAVERGVRIVRSESDVRPADLDGDVIITAAGDVPNVEWLQDSGLPLASGVVVDDRCRVAPGIVAAGDVTVRLDGAGRPVRRPHWTNAVEQGTAAALALMHDDIGPYQPEDYFWTEQFGWDVKMMGRLPAPGEPEILDATDGSFLAVFSEGGRVCTAVAANYGIPRRRLAALVPG